MLSKLLIKISSLFIFSLALFSFGFIRGRQDQRIRNIRRHNETLNKRIAKTKKVLEKRAKINRGGRATRNKFLRQNKLIT